MSPNPEQQAETIKCPIWPDFQANVSFRDPDDGTICIMSDRAGGSYSISPEAIAELERRITFRLRWQQEPGLRVSTYDRTRLTTWLVDQMLLGDEEPMVTPEVISSIRRKGRLPVHERANRLLRFIAGETPVLGSAIEFDRHAGPSNARGERHKATLRAFAWTESSQWLELNYLLDYLTGRGLLELIYQYELPTNYYRATVDGHAEMARNATAIFSNKAFVAMWFDDTMNDAYYQGFEPAIRDAGYEPVRIDNVEHAGQIEDAIIAEIRKSRFVIADLTQGDDGARGGVYYEAGFARGLKLEVIFTCREDKFSLVHFDANHQAHILWNGYEDLRTKLRNRIEAVVGPGPTESHYDREPER